MFKKILNEKKFAEKRSVNFTLALINSIGLTYVLSWKISFLFWSSLKDLSPIEIELASHLPLMIFGILTLTLLPWIIRSMVIIAYYGQKIIFIGIQRFDLWYWKKYRQESLISESIWKVQNSIQKIDTAKKRLILVTVVSAYTAYLGMMWT